jgi:hypothetical protein
MQGLKIRMRRARFAIIEWEVLDVIASLPAMGRQMPNARASDASA